MYRYIIFSIFLSTTAYSSSYYNNFYSDFHNSTKTFTDNADMHEKSFREKEEVNLPWINALVRIPLGNGDIYRGSMNDLRGMKIF